MPKWSTQTIGNCTPLKINERLTNWCGLKAAQGSQVLPQQLDNGRTRSQSGTSQIQSLCCWKYNTSARAKAQEQRSLIKKSYKIKI